MGAVIDQPQPSKIRTRLLVVVAVAVLSVLGCWMFHLPSVDRLRNEPNKSVEPNPASALAELPFNRWPVTGGGHITIDRTESYARLIGPTGDVLHSFGNKEIIHGSSLSKGRSCLLLLVVSEDSLRSGAERAWYRYAYVLRVRRNGAGEWRAWRTLRDAQSSMDVAELGAVSDDGKVAILKMCIAEGTVPGVRYEWQTRSLITGLLTANPIELQLQYGFGR